jgi:hypothetical protein
VTTWFERRPGSEETLLALYDAVVSAEELDLAEQADSERLWSFLLDDEPVADGTEPHQPDDLEDDDGRLTMSQALGMVAHLLGGRPLGIEPTA